MSKTALQKEARATISGLPINATLCIDHEAGINVQRRSPSKWHMFFQGTGIESVTRRSFTSRKANRIEERERARRQLVITILHWRKGAAKDPYGAPIRAELTTRPQGEYQTLLGGQETWHDTLEQALETAKETLVTLDAAKRLRGDDPTRP